MLLNVGIRLNVVLLIRAPLLLADPSSSSNIDFSREILPILSDACFQCHGPDSKSRKADLRLDVEESTKRLSDAGIPIIDPGNADHSDLIQRLITKDPDDLMPPPELDRPLDEEKIEKIRDWINQGAPWGKHWSLNPIERPTPPTSGMHPIDAFVDRTLETEGLKAQPAADRRTLIRRLALDLIGLPPTPEEVAEFCVNRLISIGDDAHPVIQAQARAYRDHMLAVVTHYIKMGIEQNRATMSAELRKAGQHELADQLRRI